MKKITITRPDDWHCHLRDGAALGDIVKPTAARFARAIIMPNTVPPTVNHRLACEYRQRILAHSADFCPLMTLYATDSLSAADIHACADDDTVVAVKLYPKGATTNSANGVTDIRHLDNALAAMVEIGMPLLVHGEVTDSEIDIFDREAVFIERILKPLLDKFPDLKVVLEHITTREAAEFVQAGSANLAATITAHHLMYNRNAMLAGGVRPHFYCLPIIKREQHRQALLAAATSGHPRIFLGTDSAPHAIGSKISSCGCAGIFSAPAALEIYTQIFEDANALDKLEGFASFYGADFYNLPRNRQSVTLTKSPWQMPTELPFADSVVVPMLAGEQINWKLV